MNPKQINYVQCVGIALAFLVVAEVMAADSASVITMTGQALVKTDLKGNVLVAVDTFRGNETSGDGIADCLFVFTPLPDQTANPALDRLVDDAKISYSAQGILKVVSREGVLLDLVVGNVDPRFKTSSHIGVGIAKYVGDFRANLTDVVMEAMNGSLSVLQGNGGEECKNYTEGGQGSSQCSIGGCEQSPTSCSVTCWPGWYSCCKCLNDKASCKCCQGPEKR